MTRAKVSTKQALKKFLWYHHNALKFDRGQGGVRLSFALMYWLELAAVYPPAMEAFVYTRDETEAAFRQNPEFELFHDIASLNGHLGDGLRTADLFAEVADKDLTEACRLYHVAEPHLIGVGRFFECGPFLKPEKRMARAADCFRLLREFEESMPEGNIQPPKVARQRYVDNVATLVALLALNDRVNDVDAVCKSAFKVIDDDDFRTTLDAAMTGHFPDRLSL